MRPQDGVELKWIGTDLHVHTPASRDYKGSRDEHEYIRLIRRANQFQEATEPSKKNSRKKPKNSPIGCVAFTDHNSLRDFGHTVV
jgi:predicted metal-dependent phosphoesterase TrpH